MEQLDSNDRFLVARSDVFKLEDVSDFGASQAKCFPCCVDLVNCLAVAGAMPSRQFRKTSHMTVGGPGRPRRTEKTQRRNQEKTRTHKPVEAFSPDPQPPNPSRRLTLVKMKGAAAET